MKTTLLPLSPTPVPTHSHTQMIWGGTIQLCFEGLSLITQIMEKWGRHPDFSEMPDKLGNPATFGDLPQTTCFCWPDCDWCHCSPSKHLLLGKKRNLDGFFQCPSEETDMRTNTLVCQNHKTDSSNNSSFQVPFCRIPVTRWMRALQALCAREIGDAYMESHCS